MDELVRKVYDTIKKSEMICQGDSVIVGVSGGADSVCLLSVLKNLQMSMDLKLTAVHIHHGLRGEAADRVFVEVCKEFFPDNACGLGDKRVSIYYEDGLKFLRLRQNEYDLIINDAIDPLGHNAGLFTKEFYGNCYRALKEDGIMVYQHGSPFYDEDEESCRVMHRKASHSFPISRVYQAHIPTCSSGYWLFGFASKKYHPLEHLDAKRWKERHIKTWYYTTNLHKGAFMLPRYVEDMLEEEEDRKK